MKKYLISLIVLLSFLVSGCSCLCSYVEIKENPSLNYPVHYLGLVPSANGQTQYQLDLFVNNTFYLRTVFFKDGVVGKNSDDIGRWYLDGENRIVLKDGREAVKYFYMKESKTIEVMDLEGERIESEFNYKLSASNTAKTIEPQLFMTGMYSYMADAANFKECLTGANLNVAFEEDSISIERAYLKIKKVAGQALKVHVEGKIILRDGEDGLVNVPTLVVKKFLKIIPKESCQSIYTKAKLINTYWKLTMLNGKVVRQTQNNRREAHIVLSQGKLRGNSGCNGMGGSYTLDGDKLSFSDKGMMMTRMFCKGSVEREFLKAMKAMYSCKIKGEYLEIFDKDSVKLAQFESVYLY